MMQRKLIIQDRVICDSSLPFVIAEIGHNHQGNLETCEKLFIEAAKAGADAVKLQKRHNKFLYTDEFYNSPYTGPTSFGSTYGEHREFLEFDLNSYKHLKTFAEKLGLIFFATAFDLKSVDFLDSVGVPVFKIASGDLKSIPLLKYTQKTGKPIILSTGGSNLSDVEFSYKYLNPKSTAVLQCTAAYPANADQMNLNVISTFRNTFPESVIGLSSHDRGISFPVVATALGARIIEKHFTLDRSMKGTDHAFSLEPAGLEKMVRDLTLVSQAMGDGVKKAIDSELQPLIKMGKMIVYSRDLVAGHSLKDSDLEIRSPMQGVSAQQWDAVIGKKLLRNVSRQQPLRLDDF
jgi:N-acetylneuraminate synthase/sialic acid synthase